jgi:hypothetical protein
MWENIIDPAAVNIDLIAQQRGCHCAALDVPAGATTTPGRIPAHLAIGFVPGFPKRKIANVFLLVLIVANASGWPQFFQIQMRQLSVIGKFVDPKVH